ncbi:hypothetical protein ACWO4B_003229 [Clostridium sporogenes]
MLNYNKEVNFNCYLEAVNGLKRNYKKILVQEDYSSLVDFLTKLHNKKLSKYDLEFAYEIIRLNIKKFKNVEPFLRIFSNTDIVNIETLNSTHNHWAMENIRWSLEK